MIIRETVKQEVWLFIVSIISKTWLQLRTDKKKEFEAVAKEYGDQKAIMTCLEPREFCTESKLEQGKVWFRMGEGIGPTGGPMGEWIELPSGLDSKCKPFMTESSAANPMTKWSMGWGYKEIQDFLPTPAGKC